MIAIALYCASKTATFVTNNVSEYTTTDNHVRSCMTEALTVLLIFILGNDLFYEFEHILSEIKANSPQLILDTD